MKAPYLDPEGGRPDIPTQAVRHTCSGNLGIVKIASYKQKSIAKTIFLAGRWAPGLRDPVLKHTLAQW